MTYQNTLKSINIIYIENLFDLCYSQKRGRDNMNREQTHWVPCPTCGQPHLLKRFKDTQIRHFPAYCKKCKGEVIITLEPQSRVVNQ